MYALLQTTRRFSSNSSNSHRRRGARAFPTGHAAKLLVVAWVKLWDRGRERERQWNEPCRRSRHGATCVEFAFVAPIVIMMVFGLVHFAALLMSQNVLTAAAREGGRMASMPR